MRKKLMLGVISLYLFIMSNEFEAVYKRYMGEKMKRNKNHSRKI